MTKKRQRLQFAVSILKTFCCQGSGWTFDSEATFEGNNLTFWPIGLHFFPKGDILVRPDMAGPERKDAIIADPDRLWPNGMVEYKFYRTFPR